MMMAARAGIREAVARRACKCTLLPQLAVPAPFRIESSSTAERAWSDCPLSAQMKKKKSYARLVE